MAEVSPVKKKYRDLCAEEKSLPLFSQDWWLDAVCGRENWNVVLAEGGGQVIGSLPYHINSLPGARCIEMPLLTQNMGVWLRYPEGQKYTARLAFEKEVMTELIDGLPPFDCFRQSFHHSVTNWLPFYWQGFQQTTRYTYVIEDLSDLEQVYADFKGSVRTEIRKAGKNGVVVQNGEMKDLYALICRSFKRQGLRRPFSSALALRVDEALKANNAGRMWLAVDSAGRKHSGLYLTWDRETAYVHMAGDDYDLRSSGSGCLIIWEAIKFARNELGLRRFDFEGSMVEGIESSRRSFGARQVPYFQIWKDKRGIIKRLLNDASRKAARAVEIAKTGFQVQR